MPTQVLQGGTLKSLAPEAVQGRILQSLDLRNNAGYDAFINGIAGTPIPAPTGTNKYVDIGTVRPMRKRIGPRKVERLREISFQISNEDYENTVVVYDWEKRRDQFDLVQRRIEDVRRTYVTHWQELGSYLLGIGETERCYDGQFFFSASHAEHESGTQTNLATVTGIAAPDSPTIAEFKTVVWKAIRMWRELKDDQGQPIQMNLSQVWLVVPIAYEQVANDAMNPRAGDTAATALSVDGTKFNLVVDNRQTQSAGGSLYRSIMAFAGGHQSIVRQTEVDLELTYKDDIHDNKREEYGITTTRGIGFGDWKGAMKVKLAA